MAKLNEQDFKKEVLSLKIKSLYLIYGEEKYLVKKYTEALVNKIAGDEPSELDFFSFDSDTSLENICAAADRLPMMSDRICVVVKDFDINGLSESDYKELESFCENLEESTVLVFTMPTYDPSGKKDSGKKQGGGKFSKFISFAEKAGTVLELKKPGDMALERQLVAWADWNGCVLSQLNASKIISGVGSDMTALKNEVDKLCAFANGGIITEDMIRRLCVKNIEARIYSLSDYITKNDFNSTYRQLHFLFEQNEKPEIILSVLSSAFVDMYRMRAAAEAGKSISDVAADFKYGRREFVLKNAANNVRKYSTEALREILGVILETDIKLKSTRSDYKVLLETMIAKLLLIVQKGGNV